MSLVSCVSRVAAVARRVRNARAVASVVLFVAAFPGLSAVPAWAGAGPVARFVSATAALGGGLNTPAGLAADSKGNVYVAGQGNNSVEEIPAGCASASCVKTLGRGFSGPEGVAVDGSGNVYVADSGNKAVKEIPAGCTATSCVKTLGGGFSGPESVAVDGSGNVYVADADSTALKKIPAGCTSGSCVQPVGGFPAVVQAVALDGSGNIYISDGWAVLEMPTGCTNGGCMVILAAGFTNTEGIAVDASGNVYVADAGSNEADEIPAGCTSLSCVQTLSSGFSSLFGIAVDPKGNVYLADQDSSTITEQEPGGVNFSSVPVGSTSAAQTLTFSFSAYSDVHLDAPVALTEGAPNLDFAVASGGTCVSGVYFTHGQSCTVDVTFSPKFAGERNGAVELTDTNGRVIATANVYGVGTGPQAVFGGSAPITLGGGFTYPYGVAVDGSGNVYVADTSMATVEKIPPGCTDASCMKALGGGFSAPNGVVLDGSGNIYVADSNNNAVKEIPASCINGANNSSCVTTLGGGFNAPVDVAVDGSGDVYVADLDNNAVKEIPASCISGSNDSSCVETLGGGFDYPAGVAVDGSGNVYVANYDNNAVQEIPASCISGSNDSSCVETLGGGFIEPENIAVDAGGDVYVPNGAGSALQEIPPGCTTSACVITLSNAFNGPGGVALDGSGNLYVADTDNAEVRVIPQAGAPSLTFATSTNVGSVDAKDGTQAVQVQNIGNENLTFATPETGSNPSYPANFPEDTTANNLCASGTSLVAGASCDVAVRFQPTGAGSSSGNVVLTDNDLNVSNATQKIGASGTGIAAGDKTSISTAVPSSSYVNGDQVTVTATVADATNAGTVPVGTVTFTDTVGTTITTLGTETVGSNGQASITWTPSGTGVHTVTTSFTPTDTTKFQASSDTTGASFTLNAYGAAASFTVSAAKSPTYVGAADTLTITALDAEGNTVADFSGAPTLTSTDSKATFSSVAWNDGVGTATVSFAATGTQTVTATASSVTGTSAGVTVQADPKFVVTVTTDDVTGAVANCTDQNAQGATPDANCSVRDALAAATAVGTSWSTVPMTVTFSPEVFKATNTAAQNTIFLTGGSDLLIPSNTTVQGLTAGSGAALQNLITVDGGSDSYGTLTDIFVASGESGVALKNLIIAHGFNTSGGGILNHGTLTIDQCSIVSNQGYNLAGGILNTGSLTVQDSTIAGNSASGLGGGIGNLDGILNLSHVTITGNSAGAGGGIYFVGISSLKMVDTTISGNSATSSAGGILVKSAVDPTVNNSIIAGNTAPAEADMLLGGDATGLDGTGNIVGTSPDLAVLGNYGGPTQTMIPLPGSPAICAGAASNIPEGDTTDQRGYADTVTYGTQSCVDAGAVQTNYSLTFKKQPSSVLQGLTISPSPTVELDENGVPFTAEAVSVPLTLSGSGNLTGGTASTTSGVATYSGLSVDTVGTGDKLKAGLTLNSSPATSISTTSDTFDVTPLADTLKLSGVPTTAQAGNSFQVTVTGYLSGNVASSYTGPVTVTSTDGNLSVSNPITLTNGVAMFNVTLGTAGKQTITVTDAANSLTATSAQIDVAAGSAAYVRLVSGSGQSTTIGSSFANPLVARVYDMYGNPVSGATVNFTVPASGASAVLSSASPVSGSDGTVSVTATANGTASSSAYIVTATVPNAGPTPGVVKGLKPMEPAKMASFTLTNQQAQTKLAVTASSAALVYGQPVALNAAITPASAGGSDPSGTITFYDGETELTSATVSGAAADYKIALPTVGVHDYAAAYGGDTDFAASSRTSASSVVVSKAKVTLTGPTTQPVFVVNGQAGSISVGIAGQYSGNGIAAPSGSLSYTISDSLGSGTAEITNGAATIPVSSSFPAGTYTVTVTYAGDANYNAATTTVALQVGRITPVVSLAQPGAIGYGTSLGSILNATTASGSTSLTAAGSTTYTATASGGSPVAVSSGTVLPAGIYTLTATWMPDSTNAATYDSASKSVSLTVNKALLTVAANNATRAYGAANPSFTGAVTGAVNGDSFTESFTTSATASSAAGTYSIVPSASGTDLSDYSVTTDDGTLTVTQAASATTLTSSSASANLNASVTLTATVTSATSGMPTGSVQFLDGTTVLGSAAVDNQGVATYTVDSLTAGTHLITAVYNGDKNFVESTSAQLVQTVTSPDYTLTANPSSLTLKAGQTGKVTFTFAPVGGFTGTVNFSCAGLPASASCSFSPPSLTADGSNKTQTSELTITTEGSNSGTVAMNEPPGSSGGGMMGASLFFLPALIFGGFLMSERKKLNGGVKALLVLLIVASGMTGMTGCGFRPPAARPGTSVVTVTATATGSGSSADTHTASFTLTITQ